MELPVCSQEGRHHFGLCLPADSPLPRPYGDLDHLRKHCHSSCPLICLLLFTLTKTNRSMRRSWHPPLPHVVLPGPSPWPPTQICFWIPRNLCHTSFQTQYCGDLLPSQSSPWLLWWDGCPPKLLPWRWHTTRCPGWLQHPPSYFSENDLLDLDQSGFRTGHSTQISLFMVAKSLGAARAFPLWLNLALLTLL